MRGARKRETGNMRINEPERRLRPVCREVELQPGGQIAPNHMGQHES